MPVNRAPLELAASPGSVQESRRWVGEVLTSLGRDDLVSSAELGVSELVTNAILHASPPIAVAVRGTRAHPRVEVRDNSHQPPRINVDMTEDEHLLSTIGRGLGIVSLYSVTWGSDVGADGKTVWFEPCADAAVGGAEGDTTGESFDFAQYVERRVASSPPPTALMSVQLLNLPVGAFAELRTRYAELRRELRLLSISHGSEYPLAVEFSELFPHVELERRQSRGVEQVDAAIANGAESVDVAYQVPTSAATTMSRLLDLSEAVDRFCIEEKLLMLAASPAQRALQRWYLGEFVRQAAGEDPVPWSASLVDETEQPAPQP